MKKIKIGDKCKGLLLILVYIFIGFMLIYNITIITLKIVSPSKTPSFLGFKAFVIKSGSMMPSIDVGDVVVVRDVLESELEVGDVITYQNNGGVVTHRIVETENEKRVRYVTKGDYNNTVDDVELFYNDIEGKVFCVVPKIGNIVMLFQNKTILVVFIVLGAFSLYMLGSNINKKRLDN